MGYIEGTHSSKPFSNFLGHLSRTKRPVIFSGKDQWSFTETNPTSHGFLLVAPKMVWNMFLPDLSGMSSEQEMEDVISIDIYIYIYVFLFVYIAWKSNSPKCS